MTWDVVGFVNTWNTTPHQRSVEWDQLVEVLTTFRIHTGEKKALPGWSPARYRPGAKRGRDGVEALSCLVLDYDDGTTIDEALRAWFWRPGILHTSYSHTPDHHRFRVVMPLAHPVPAEDWRGVFRWADRWTRKCTNEPEVGGPEQWGAAKWKSTIDGQCKDPGRFYYVPALRDENAPRYATAWHPSGGYLGIHLPWSRELERFKAEQQARKKRQNFPPVKLPRSAANRELKRRLKTDPGTRERLGIQLGGKVSANRVTGVRCPACSRNSVWWFVDVERKSSAECNHRNSCGWAGSLLGLAQ